VPFADNGSVMGIIR